MVRREERGAAEHSGAGERRGAGGHGTARALRRSPRPAAARPAERPGPAPARRRQWAAALGAGGRRGSSARPARGCPWTGPFRPEKAAARGQGAAPQRQRGRGRVVQPSPPWAPRRAMQYASEKCCGAVAGLQAAGQEGGSTPALALKSPPKHHHQQ